MMAARACDTQGGWLTSVSGSASVGPASDAGMGAVVSRCGCGCVGGGDDMLRQSDMVNYVYLWMWWWWKVG